jgi:hypothetical protein
VRGNHVGRPTTDTTGAPWIFVLDYADTRLNFINDSPLPMEVARIQHRPNFGLEYLKLRRIRADRHALSGCILK